MTKKHTLSKAKDQRDALLRALATELFLHGEIKTTMARAKALRPYAEGIITLAKKGDLAAIRQAARHIYNKETGKFMDLKTGEVFDEAVADKKLAPQMRYQTSLDAVPQRNENYTEPADDEAIESMTPTEASNSDGQNVEPDRSV